MAQPIAEHHSIAKVSGKKKVQIKVANPRSLSRCSYELWGIVRVASEKDVFLGKNRRLIQMRTGGCPIAPGSTEGGESDLTLVCV